VNVIVAFIAPAAIAFHGCRQLKTNLRLGFWIIYGSAVLMYVAGRALTTH
jgi:hypothetical protein